MPVAPPFLAELTLRWESQDSNGEETDISSGWEKAVAGWMSAVLWLPSVWTQAKLTVQ